MHRQRYIINCAVGSYCLLQIGVQTNYERNLNASTIRTHLDFANQIVKERNKLGVLSDSPLLTQFESLPLAVYLFSFCLSFFSFLIDN